MNDDNCLIIATYNGNYKNSVREPNKVFFNNIKCVLENTNLSLFKKIIIVVSEETNEMYINKLYDSYLRNIIQTDKLNVIWKKNDEFLSYSSYYEGYKYDSSHKYYFFVEDDYILTEKYVKVAIETIEKNKWGYIFGDINYNHKIIHACHCLCVAKQETLQITFTDYYEKMISIARRYELVHQLCFFRLFKESGILGEDFKQTNYTLMFWKTPLSIYCFYSNYDKENLVWPIQYFYFYNKKHLNNKDYNEYLLENNTDLNNN